MNTRVMTPDGVEMFRNWGCKEGGGTEDFGNCREMVSLECREILKK